MAVIGDYFKFQNGYAFKSKDFTTNGKYKIIKIKELKDGAVKFFTDSAEINPNNGFDEEKYIVRKGDVLFALTGDPVNKSNPLSWVGRVAIYNHEQPALLNQRVCKAIPISYISNEFLYYFFRQDVEFYNLASKATGSASQANISTKTIEQHEFVPPTEEDMERMVTVLKNLDRKIEINEKISENLKFQLQLIFEDMFIDKAADDWETKRIGDYLELERGLSYKGKYLSETDEGVPMLNLGNILPNSVFRPEKLKYYTGEYKERNVVKPGDVIIANTDLTQAREVLGSAIRVPDLGYDEVICSHHISIVRNSKISNNFILGLLNLPTYRTRVAGFATGTTVLALPNDTILDCEFKCPPDDVLKRFDEIANPIYKQMETNRLLNDKLILLRDSFLPKLISGELDVSEVLVS